MRPRPQAILVAALGLSLLLHGFLLTLWPNRLQATALAPPPAAQALQIRLEPAPARQNGGASELKPSSPPRVKARPVARSPASAMPLTPTLATTPLLFALTLAPAVAAREDKAMVTTTNHLSNKAPEAQTPQPMILVLPDATISGVLAARCPLHPAPMYPYQARRQGQSGQVLVAFQVDSLGKISASRIERSSGVASLDQAALEILGLWQCQASMDGAHDFLQWFEFSLQGEGR